MMHFSQALCEGAQSSLLRPDLDSAYIDSGGEVHSPFCPDPHSRHVALSGSSFGSSGPRRRSRPRGHQAA